MGSACIVLGKKEEAHKEEHQPLYILPACTGISMMRIHTKLYRRI